MSMDDTVQETNTPQEVLTVELSGIEIKNKVMFYNELTAQLLLHIRKSLEQASNIKNDSPIPDDVSQAYKSIIERYIVSLQKKTKWNEFYSYFCITNTVNILGKQTSLQDAIGTRDGFIALLEPWKKASQDIADKSFSTRLKQEPTLDTLFLQQQNLASIIHAYESVIIEAKTKKIVLSVTKQFFEL